MILADTHVHIYPCFDLKAFLDGAADNFRAAADGHGIGNEFTGVLFLTESSGCNAFQTLNEMACRSAESPAGWSLRTTRDETALLARRGDTGEMCIIAGRQIESREGLEVLALGTDGRFEDRSLCLEDLIKNVSETGALSVVPWGAGKWWGRRGAVLSEVLRESGRDDFFLGDNGGRPVFWAASTHFGRAHERGIRVLPGSDPLPFKTEVRRVGSYGLMLDMEADLESPTASIKQKLRDPETQFAIYGRGENVIRFLRNQTAMQVRKRMSIWNSRRGRKPS